MSHSSSSSSSSRNSSSSSYVVGVGISASSSSRSLTSGRPSIVPPVLGSAARFCEATRLALRMTNGGQSSSTAQLMQLAPLTTWSALDLLPEQPPELECDEPSLVSVSLPRLSGLRACLSVWRVVNLEQWIIKAAHYAQLKDYASARFLYDEVIGWIDGALMSGQAGQHAGAGFVPARSAILSAAVHHGKPLPSVLAGALVARQCNERLGLPIDCLSVEDSVRRRKFCGAVHPFLLPYTAAELRELRAIMKINLRHLDGLETELAQPVATLRIGYRDAHGQPHFFRNAQERAAWEAQQKRQEQMRQMQMQQQQQQQEQEERRRQLAQQQQNELRNQRTFMQLEQERARQQRKQQMQMEQRAQIEQQAEMEQWQAQAQGQTPLSSSHQRRSSMWIEDTPPDAIAAVAAIPMVDNEAQPTDSRLLPQPSQPASNLREFVQLSPSSPSNSSDSHSGRQTGRRQIDVSVKVRRTAAAAQRGRTRSSAPARPNKPKAQGSRAKSARAPSRSCKRELNEGMRMAADREEPPSASASDERMSRTPELVDEEAQWQPLPPVTSLLAADSPAPSPATDAADPSPLPPLPSAPRQLITDSTVEEDNDAPTLSRRGQKRQRRVVVSDDESSSDETDSNGAGSQEDDDDDGEAVMPVSTLSLTARGKHTGGADELMSQQSAASAKMGRRLSGAEAKTDRPLVKVASSSRPLRKLQRKARSGGHTAASENSSSSDEDPDEPMMAVPVAVSVGRTRPKPMLKAVRTVQSPMKLRAQIKQVAAGVVPTAAETASATPPFTPVTDVTLTPFAADVTSTPFTPGLELTRRMVTDAKGMMEHWEWVYVARSWTRGANGGRLESRDHTFDAKTTKGNNSAEPQSVKKRPLIANLRRVEEHDTDAEMKGGSSTVAAALPSPLADRSSVPSLVSPSLDDTPTTTAAVPAS